MFKFSMLNIQDTNFLITITLLAVAYITSIYLIGLGQLQLIALMGDKSVLRKFAPSNLYPLEHFDSMGFVFFLFTGFGWSKTLEIKNYSITGQYKKLRTFIARNAQAITCLFWAIAILLISFLDFGKTMHAFLLYVREACKNNISLVNEVSSAFPDLSSLSIVIGLFLSSIIMFCAANATLHIFLTGIKWLYERAATHSFGDSDEAQMAETVFSIILFMLYGQRLFALIMWSIMRIAQLLALIFGIL